MTAHTSGPWKAAYVVREHIAINGPAVVDADGGSFINIAVCYLGHPNAKANARLIAAAPEMLEALHEIVLAIDGLHPNSEVVRALNRKGSAARQVLLALKVANAAIAKASGETA